MTVCGIKMEDYPLNGILSVLFLQTCLLEWKCFYYYFKKLNSFFLLFYFLYLTTFFVPVKWRTMITEPYAFHSYLKTFLFMIEIRKKKQFRECLRLKSKSIIIFYYTFHVFSILVNNLFNLFSFRLDSQIFNRDLFSISITVLSFHQTNFYISLTFISPL